MLAAASESGIPGDRDLVVAMLALIAGPRSAVRALADFQ
jgi:hypothetical protein